MPTATRGRTRWIAAPLAGVGLAILALLYQMASTGAMGVGFTTADRKFQVYANYLEGTVAAGFMAPNSGFSSESAVGVTELGVKQARVAGLCLINTEDAPLIGTTTLVITAGVPVKAAFGDRSTFDLADGVGGAITIGPQGELTGDSLADSVTVTDLYLNATNISAYGRELGGVDLGRDAGTVAAETGIAPWSNDQVPPQPGGFGLGIDRLNLGDFAGGSYGVDLRGTVELKHLTLRVYPGVVGQDKCQSQASAS